MKARQIYWRVYDWPLIKCWVNTAIRRKNFIGVVVLIEARASVCFVERIIHQNIHLYDLLELRKMFTENFIFLCSILVRCFLIIKRSRIIFASFRKAFSITKFIIYSGATMFFFIYNFMIVVYQPLTCFIATLMWLAITLSSVRDALAIKLILFSLICHAFQEKKHILLSYYTSCWGVDCGVRHAWKKSPQKIRKEGNT